MAQLNCFPINSTQISCYPRKPPAVCKNALLKHYVGMLGILTSVGCTTVQIEYDRMTGTQFPQQETVSGDQVNLSTIYLQGDRIFLVDEDDTNIAPLTGPANPADPDQYDYLTDAELETVTIANRDTSIGPIEFACGQMNRLTCTRYHLYGIVVDHFRETNDGSRREGLLGRMFDAEERSAFVGYWSNSVVSSDNAKFLRSTAHEIGHAVNLNHCDGDGSMTIMNQTGVVGDTFNYEFSSTSLDHLQNHSDDVIWPGIGSREYACPHAH